MSQTKAELVNGLSVNAALADAITVDSSGNLGIGTNDPAGESINGSQNLVIMDTSSDGGMNIKTGTSGLAQIHFSDTSGNGQGRLVYAHSDDSMRLFSAGSERMRIDSSGNVGFGTTPRASTGLHISRSGGETKIELQRNETNTTGNVGIINFTASDGHSVANIGAFGDGDNEGAYLSFKTTSAASDNSPFGTNTTERLRVHSTGVVQVMSERLTMGTSSISGGATSGNFCVEFSSATGNAIKLRDTHNAGSTNYMMLVGGSAIVGSITGTTGAASFNNLSDYRSKENDVKITDGITKLKLLRPIRFNYKTDSSTLCDGFFAHEVTPAVPTAVTGEKDAVDSEGEISPQMLDSSKLVPLLTAALQEEIGKREALEARVATLEAA